jgi:hypothetical protein
MVWTFFDGISASFDGISASFDGISASTLPHFLSLSPF